MFTIYHNPRCRKSRETLNLIKEAGMVVDIVEYLKTPPTAKELKKIVKMLGISISDLIRKNESLYKEQYKGKVINDEEWFKILSKNPILLERPIVVKDEEAILGRPPDNVLKLL